MGYKKFWIDPDLGQILRVKPFASDYVRFTKVIDVKALDRASVLLRRIHEHLIIANSKGYGCGPLTKDVEKFLKELES